MIDNVYMLRLMPDAVHPQPLKRREPWYSLNGKWDFAIDAEEQWKKPSAVQWNAVIETPFAPETSASGVGNTGFYRSCWYRCRFRSPSISPETKHRLHFGAVDYTADIWINNVPVGGHEGGYTPFCFEISDHYGDANVQELVVRARDDPHDLAKPRGKQDWLLEPHSIWYPRTTGIWQTVWIEEIPPWSIASVSWMPSVDRWEIGVEAAIEGQARDDLRLTVKLQVGDRQLANDTYAVSAGEVRRRIGLSDPGIDDYRNELLWSPSRPTLIQAELQLWGGRGQLLDVLQSYTALRSIGVQGDRFVLNGRPYPLRLVLDQGYWPETGLTAPNDEALRRDVELAKAMGFNGVRKHQKIEDPRYLYWADVLGLLVWEEMPSAYRYTKQSIDRLTREWSAVIERDHCHPCIVAWVPFNESWGVPDLPDSPAQRHYVQAIYHLTRTLDPTRPVVGNDGWESVATDIIGIHDYDDQVMELSRRYRAEDELVKLFRRERPGGRLLVLDEQEHASQPIMLTEFGGIACSDETTQTWGYSRAGDSATFGRQYESLLRVIRSLPLFAGFCYTQFSDTYQEANGLLKADRTPKIPLDEIARATGGPRTPHEREIELHWRERLMTQQRHGGNSDHRMSDER